jgi:hypothetical protein
MSDETTHFVTACARSTGLELRARELLAMKWTGTVKSVIMAQSSTSNIMSDPEAETFLSDAKHHAEGTAKWHLAIFKEDDEQLARGPDRNEGFNDFMRSKGMNWMNFEQTDKLFARYCSDMYTWWQGYEYRRLLVKRLRDSIN